MYITLRIDDLIINEKYIKNISMLSLRKNRDSYLNEKNKNEILITGYVEKDLIQNIFSLSEKFFTVELEINDITYTLKKCTFIK